MENVVLDRRRDESGGFDTTRFLVMRTLARLQECDQETLLHRIDASEREVDDVLMKLISENEVVLSQNLPARGGRKEVFTLTLKGWGEYMNALGSFYELPE